MWRSLEYSRLFMETSKSGRRKRPGMPAAHKHDTADSLETHHMINIGVYRKRFARSSALPYDFVDIRLKPLRTYRNHSRTASRCLAAINDKIKIAYKH